MRRERMERMGLIASPGVAQVDDDSVPARQLADQVGTRAARRGRPPDDDTGPGPGPRGDAARSSADRLRGRRGARADDSRGACTGPCTCRHTPYQAVVKSKHGPNCHGHLYCHTFVWRTMTY